MFGHAILGVEKKNKKKNKQKTKNDNEKMNC